MPKRTLTWQSRARGLYQIGVIAEVLRVIELADDNLAYHSGQKQFRWTKWFKQIRFMANLQKSGHIKAADDDKE
jgi:hypothetical protein